MQPRHCLSSSNSRLLTMALVLTILGLVCSGVAAAEPRDANELGPVDNTSSKLQDNVVPPGDEYNDIVEESEAAKWPIERARMKLPNWHTYQRAFKKHYRSLSEQLVHLKAFVARSALIVARNLSYLSGRSTYYLSVNSFTDWTQEERRKLLQASPIDGQLDSRLRTRRDLSEAGAETASRDRDTGSPSLSGQQAEPASGAQPQPVGDSWAAQMFGSLINLFNRSNRKLVGEPGEHDKIDWQLATAGCLNEPDLTQGECNSCYAFSLMRLLEWLHCGQSGGHEQGRPAARFSEQYLVDCGRLSGLEGCSGGAMRHMLAFVKEHGVLPAPLMPYLGYQRAQCHLNESQSRALIPVESIEYKLLRQPAEWAAPLSQQPLLVYLRLEDSFLDYGGGLYGLDYCEPDKGHYMVLIGHHQLVGGPGAGPRSVWRLSNSLGRDWGESGYIRMELVSGECVGYAIKIEARFGRSPGERLE